MCGTRIHRAQCHQAACAGMCAGDPLATLMEHPKARQTAFSLKRGQGGGAEGGVGPWACIRKLASRYPAGGRCMSTTPGGPAQLGALATWVEYQALGLWCLVPTCSQARISAALIDKIRFFNTVRGEEMRKLIGRGLYGEHEGSTCQRP